MKGKSRNIINLLSNYSKIGWNIFALFVYGCCKLFIEEKCELRVLTQFRGKKIVITNLVEEEGLEKYKLVWNRVDYGGKDLIAIQNLQQDLR